MQRYHWILMGIVLGTTSCTTAKLEELRTVSPKGSAFQMALTREYLAFSESEARQYDWIDSYHFADKGLRVAYGQEVEPEEVKEWNIDSPYLPELRDARKALIEQLKTKEKIAEKPDIAARAQYFFDCWVEQQEEGWQTKDITDCRNGFYAALSELKAEEDATPIIRTTAYMVFFDHNSAVITTEGNHVLQRVIEDLQKTPEAEVLLHGHADTSGTDSYNMSLSEKRAKAVRQVLAADGIEDSRIIYYAFGETDLRVPTADGIREPGNRRVEIFLE